MFEDFFDQIYGQNKPFIYLCAECKTMCDFMFDNNRDVALLSVALISTICDDIYKTNKK